MKTNQEQASTNFEELIKYMDKLKDSPVVNAEYYSVHLSNLCDAIKQISDDAGRGIESINKSIEDNTIHQRMHLIEQIQNRFWIIGSMAEVIQEKVLSNDYVDLDNLFYHYREHQKEQN